MITTGQCPSCYATNSLSATNCLDCRQALPWADQVLEDQRRKAAANAAAEAEERTRQSKAQQDQVNQSIQQAIARRSQMAPSLANSAPGQVLDVNPFHVYADAFVGRFADSLEHLDKASAAWFGLICAVIANVCMIFGFRMIVSEFANLLGGFIPALAVPNIPSFDPMSPGMITPVPDEDATSLLPNPVTPTPPDVLSHWKWAVVALTPWLSIGVSCTIMRKLFGGEERSLEGDVFIAGVTLLPTGLFVLAAGMLGYSNWQVIAALSVFCLTYTILLLYRGLTTVSMVRDMAAAFSVPLVLMLSAYLTRIVFARLLTL